VGVVTETVTDCPLSSKAYDEAGEEMEVGTRAGGVIGIIVVVVAMDSAER
jgi:hypothetical protein